jgi:hypothetical protein
MLPATACAVFISYAHADNESQNPKERWLDRFVEFLMPLVRQEDFTLCSDQDTKIGLDWHKHIQAHINGAKAVVLLISPAFLASDYIRVKRPDRIRCEFESEKRERSLDTRAAHFDDRKDQCNDQRFRS